MSKLCIVVPCYNEEEMLDYTTEHLSEYLKMLINKGKISQDSKILYVNDGSKDRTWEYIQNIVNENKLVMGINLSANVGHQNALVAGLFYTVDKFDVTISIDADLQDDVTVMEEMIDKYEAGCDVVYGVRSSRETDTFFKRTTAQLFYKIMSRLGVKSVYNHADYRLMSNRAVKSLSKYEESNLFLRGIVPLIGYQSDNVYYSRKERLAGESKYPLKKMIKFAFDGITSFSVKPITAILILGITIIGISVLAFIYIMISYFTSNVNPGWTSIMASLWFLGGVQLFSIGLIGSYLGKVYIEVKKRPRYNIESVIKENDKGEKYV